MRPGAYMDVWYLGWTPRVPSDKTNLRRAGQLYILSVWQNALHSGTLKQVQRSSAWLWFCPPFGWPYPLYPPRALVPAHRCKHVWFGMRLGGCLPAEATLTRLSRYTGWLWLGWTCGAAGTPLLLARQFQAQAKRCFYWVAPITERIDSSCVSNPMRVLISLTASDQHLHTTASKI